MYKKLIIAVLFILPNLFVVTTVQAATQCSGMVLANTIADGADIAPAMLAKLLERTPKPFIPFTIQEIKDWLNNFQGATTPANPVEGDRIVLIDATNNIIYKEFKRNKNNVLAWDSSSGVSIDVLLTNFNDFERQVTELGFSVRGTGSDSLLENYYMLYTDPIKFKKQFLQDLKLKATTAFLDCLDSIPSNNCPQFDLDHTLSNLTAEVETIETLPDDSKNKVIKKYEKLDASFPVDINGNKVPLRNVITAANTTAKIGCALGINMFDLVPSFNTINLPGVPHPVINWSVMDVGAFTGDLLTGINAKLTDLSCPDFLCNALASIKFPGLSSGSFGEWWKNYTSIGFGFSDLTSAEKLKYKGMQNILNGISAQLDIPDLSNMPVLDPPTYPSLELKKRKDWPGINSGDRNRVGIESFAYYQIYGSETAQAAVAFGKFSAWLLNYEINIVSASGDFFVGVSAKSNVLGSSIPNNQQDKMLAYAYLKLRYLGSNWESQKSSGTDLSIMISPNEPIKLYRFEKAYEQQFAIGPIPCLLKIGGFFDSGIDWGAGVGPFKVFARVEPYALAAGFIEAGVGVSGFSIGAGGTLNIVDVSVPLEGAVKLGFSEAGEPSLDLEISAILDVTYLSGQLYGYVEYRLPKFWRPGWKKVRKSKTIVAFPGKTYTKPIFDWGMELGYRGLKMRGDLLDQQDLAMAAQLQGSIDIYNRAETLSEYVRKTNTRLVNFYKKLGDEIISEPIDIPIASQTVVTASANFNTNLETYKCKMSSILGSACL